MTQDGDHWHFKSPGAERTESLEYTLKKEVLVVERNRHRLLGKKAGCDEDAKH